MLKAFCQFLSFVIAIALPILMVIGEIRGAIFYFPFFAIPILTLLFFSGPLVAAGMTIFATVVGTSGFIFSVGNFGDMTFKPFVLLFQIGWIWYLFLSAQKLIEGKDLDIHRMQEEIENLEIVSADYQQEQRELEEKCGGIKERMARYAQLRSFTDELASSLQVTDVRKKTEAYFTKYFGEGTDILARLNLFSSPNHPQKGSVIDEWIVQHRVSILIPDISQDPRFRSVALRKGSIIASPLERENAIFGTMTVASPHPKKWKEHDLRLLSDISNIIALSATNAALFDKAESLAEKDALTGLYVRYRFDEKIQEEFSRAKTTGSNLTLLMVDIDHFKLVNDRWGHQSGDLVLKSIGQSLLSRKRETDFCARFGGEEIAIVMPATKIENSIQTAERIRQNIEENPVGQEKIRVTVSIGVASVRPSMNDAEDLIRTADQALYRAKTDGRNRVVCATP